MDFNPAIFRLLAFYIIIIFDPVNSYNQTQAGSEAMHSTKTSRRQFVQLAGAAALTLRHGLLPAQSNVPAQTNDDAGRAAASFGDSSVYIEWDANLHARVSRVAGESRTALTSWGPSDYLLLSDGRRAGGPQADDLREAGARKDSARAQGQHVARKRCPSVPQPQIGRAHV
jgi:hypothetical protein